MAATALNPFVVGGAIADREGKGFYGREDIFSFVRSGLQVVRRVPILLYGQRRIGKSSILQQLPSKLPSDYFCVYYDLQGRAGFSLAEVLYGLGRAIADTLGIQRPGEEEATSHTFPAFLSGAIASLQGHPERLVLLFDEFDVIDSIKDEIASKQFIPYLRELVRDFPEVGYILVVGRKTEELSESFFADLLKDAMQKRIGRLDREQVSNMVLDLAGGNLHMGEDAIDEIYTLTAGHPYCVQVLCHAIWNRFYPGKGTAKVRVEDVAAAFLPALELGTNGLNWIYDGLEQSAQRLFLAAVAVLAGPRALGSVSFAAVHDALFSRRLGVAEAELAQSPQDLQNWDVLKGGMAGYQFTVPMIGAWIQINRRLEGLEQQTQLVNPRASRLYELGIGSQQDGDLDSAILSFREALRANPVFIEAQVALASVLHSRGRKADLDDAIEAYQRALELAPQWPKTPLLEALLESMENNQAGYDLALKRFERINALEPHGPFYDRAIRLLDRMVEVRLTYGTPTYLKQAEQIFQILDRKEDAARAHDTLVRCKRIESWSSGIYLGALILAFIPFSAFRWITVPVFAALAATAMTFGTASEHDGLFKWRRLGIPSMLGAAALGFGVYRIFGTLWGAGITAFIVAGAVNSAFNPTLNLPPELSAAGDSDGRTLRDGAANALERLARSLRGSTSKGSPK